MRLCVVRGKRFSFVFARRGRKVRRGCTRNEHLSPNTMNKFAKEMMRSWVYLV
jgi:hypothetical protein